METPVPPQRPLSAALHEHTRVVLALMLRDIKTRFGGSYFGFLFGLMIPLAHIGVILTIYILLGRRAPIGTDVVVYLATAIVPFAVWSYTHQKVVQAFGQNRALTSFPIVNFGDIFIARWFVEVMNSTLIVSVVTISLLILGVDIFIHDPPSFLYTLILAQFLGASTGFIFGLLSMLSPIAALFGFVLIPIYWATSGSFFIPEALPQQVRGALWFFPLAHIVDFGRTAFYVSYMSEFPNLIYVHAVIGGNLLFCFGLNRFLRSSLTAK